MNRTILIFASGILVLLSFHSMRSTQPNPRILGEEGTVVRSIVPGENTPITSPASSKSSLRMRAGRTIEPDFPRRLSDLESLAETDPPGAMDALEDLLSNHESKDMASVIAWLTGDSSHTAAWIESLPAGPFRNGIVERLLAAAATWNPQAALAIAEALADSDLHDSAVSSVVRQWAADAPADALRAVVARNDWRESPVLGRAFLAAATEHPRQIGELFAMVSEHGIDKSYFARAAELLLAKDPSALTLWCDTIQNPEYRSAIAEAVVFHSGRNGPDVAFAWATQLNETDRRQETLQALFRRAVSRDERIGPALLESQWLSNEDHAVLSAPLGLDDQN
jgi:hypothetical protein